MVHRPPTASLPFRAQVRAGLATVVLGVLLGLGPAASATPPAPRTADPDAWLPPVHPVLVTRAFAPPARAWLAGHRGIDLRTRPGRSVRAAGTGRVVFAQVLAGRGVLVIDHGLLRTTYEPVVPDVVVGQRVRAGEVVGQVGTGTGHCGDGTCLHLGLRRARTYLDPRLLLAGRRAVLRPW